VEPKITVRRLGERDAEKSGRMHAPEATNRARLGLDDDMLASCAGLHRVYFV
jgi:hypothetical protein